MLSGVVLCAFVATTSLDAQEISQQDLIAATRPQIASRQDLVVALRSAARSGAISDIEAGLIATWGEPVTSWALEIVEDERNDEGLRVVAMQVLSYARPRYAVEPLKRLTVPQPGGRSFWASAMSALQRFPYPELAEFWRPLLRHPNIRVRIFAVNGLASSGSPSDVPLILAVEGGSTIERTRADAAARLENAANGRADPVFAGPPRPDGRFVPAEGWATGFVRTYLCRRVRCQ